MCRLTLKCPTRSHSWLRHLHVCSRMRIPRLPEYGHPPSVWGYPGELLSSHRHTHFLTSLSHSHIHMNVCACLRMPSLAEIHSISYSFTTQAFTSTTAQISYAKPVPFRQINTYSHIRHTCNMHIWTCLQRVQIDCKPTERNTFKSCSFMCVQSNLTEKWITDISIRARVGLY